MDQIKVELLDFMGSDRSIAEAAWTSSSDLEAKTKKTDEQVKELVQRLARDKHATPFESVVLRFWIKLPIAIDRQLMTHRIASHNGLSGRYRTMPTEFLEMGDDVKDILVKLGSSGNSIISDYTTSCYMANIRYKGAMEHLKEAKTNQIISNEEYKRAREFIRGVLPQHNMTERVTIINLRSFANFQKLRNSEHAQPEIRQVAKLMLKCVEEANICPVALEALKLNGWII